MPTLVVSPLRRPAPTPVTSMPPISGTYASPCTTAANQNRPMQTINSPSVRRARPDRAMRQVP